MSSRSFASVYPQFQPMIKAGQAREGLTLIELLITMLISGVLLLIMGKFLADFDASREVSKVMMELQEQGQYALDYITYGYINSSSTGPAEPHREEGIIWALSYNFYSNNNTEKRIYLRIPSSPSEIIYEEWKNQLIRRLNPSDPNNGSVIIPYLDGSQEYRRGPYEVSVNFTKVRPQTDPNRSVLIEVTVRKDGLTSTVQSVVALRNHK